MNFLLITINYGNTNITKKLIGSIEDCYIKSKIKIIIGDNNSTKKTKKELKDIKNNSSLDIDLLFFDNNLFYWPAAQNIIVKKIKSQIDIPNWTIVCNNDIIINDKEFFNNLSKYNGDKHTVIGPKILTHNKKNLNPFMKKPMNNFIKLYWKLYFKSFWISLVFNFLNKIKVFYKKEIIDDSINQVYAIHGSIMIFSKTFFLKGGYLDSKFNLFCEELTTAEITKKIGGRIFYIPQLEVVHNEHTSTSKINKKILYEFAKKSHNYFINEYLQK